MKKSFMTRALAMGLSLAMAFSLSAATNVSVASAAATPAMASKQFAVRVGGAAKSYKASAATQKSFKITKATVGNTDKATVKVNSSKKSIKVTPGTVTGSTVVTVTFKNIKTAKSTAKKYRCVVKAALEDPKPVEPETPATATKITSVKPTAADTIEVKFDAPVADATKEVKLDRAGSTVEVTTTWSDAKDSVLLTGKTAFAAGTYTVTFGDFTGTCVVTARKATSIEVLTSKVALGGNLGAEQKVYFNVLDQYGKAMNYSSNKMTITATNLTKGISMNPGTYQKNSVVTNPYFTLSTYAPDMAIGDRIAVVIALTTDPTVIASANLTIDNVYTESFEFGEVNLAGDAHAYTNRSSKYSIDYTAVDTEGNAVLLTKTNTYLGSTCTTNNITFVSSNVSTIDPKNIKIDEKGKLFFSTSGYASKVTLTAVNNVTGKTATIEIQVGESAKATKLDIAEITIAKQTTYSANDTIGKADVVVYDQYGDVMKPADVAKLDLEGSGLFTMAAGFGNITAKISDDGKYLVYVAKAGFNTNSMAEGSTYNVHFVSKTDATVNSIGKISFGEESKLASIQEAGAPDDIVVEGNAIKIKVKVLDNYNNAQVIAGSKVTGAGVITKAIGTVGYIKLEDPSGVVSESAIDVTKNDISEIALTTKIISETYDSASIRVVLQNDDHEEIDSKSYNVIISKDAATYDVSVDKKLYTSGSDTIKVTVKAMNSSFLSKYKATVPVIITTTGTIKKYNRDLAFENGVATFEIPAVSGVTGVTVTKAGSGSVTGSKSGFTVEQAGAPAYFAITTGGAITAKDNGDATVSGYTGYKTANIKVTNVASGETVTSDFATLAGITNTIDRDGNISLSFNNGYATLGGVSDLGSLTANTKIIEGYYKITITVGSTSGSLTVKVN